MRRPNACSSLNLRHWRLKSALAAFLMTGLCHLASAHTLDYRHADKKPPRDHSTSPLVLSRSQGLTHTHVLSNNDTVVNSSYLFEGIINDESGDYIISLNGEENEEYTSGEDGLAFDLSGRTWLELPPELHTDLQLDQSLSISIDFYYQNTGEDESVRVILSNKDWAYDVPGLKITAFNEKTDWQPEGIIFLQFNIGVGTQEIATRFFELPMDAWHTATVDLDFAANEVSFGVNGRKTTKSLTESEGGEAVDPSQFIAWLGQTPFRIGVHQSPEGEDPEWRNEYDIANGNGTTSNLANVFIDNFVIQSPRPEGSAEAVQSALEAFTNHLAGNATLSDADLEQQLDQLRQNLSGSDFSAFASTAKQFIDAHAQEYQALYQIYYRNNLDNIYYDDLPSISKAYVDLGVWMLESGLTPANAASAEGITFIEHTEFPGALADGAQRVQNGKADIRAQFVRDPGYLMGGMRLEPDSELAAYLYRPTGFYAPAGETVSIKVDESLVNSGLHIRVGAHADNHMVLTSTSRFPLLSADFRIESETVNVINPFGGNIYVLVPQDVDLGWVEIEIDNAVRAPYFSTRQGYETSITDWEDIKKYPGVFTDFESDKFMITVPTDQLQDFEQPTELLEKWDQIMDILQTLHGRPFERSRAEAYLLDASQLVVGSFPGGYPVTPGLYAEGENGITDGYYSPFAALNEGAWEEDTGFLIMLHELGHHHYGRFILDGEQESYVNVPAVAVLHQIYGLSYDEALKYSGYQEFSRTDAAIDWMVTHNFRNGNPIGYDPTTDFEPIETSYQARGHAKFVDLADIFDSWGALGDIYESYYLEDSATQNPANTQVGVTHDQFLQTGSQALNCNLASLFHFWGIHPSSSVFTAINQYPACEGALERVVHYLDNAPRTNEDLRKFHTEKTAVHENQLKFQIYDQLLPAFDSTYGQQLRDVGADILKAYFDVDVDAIPSKPQLNNSTFNIDANTQNDVHFSWQEALDPEGKTLSYSWVLKRADTQEVLLSRSWVEGFGITIPGEEVVAALASYLNSGVTIGLTQQVTTSDTFTVVQSDLLTTTFTTLTDTDADGISDEEELILGTDPNNNDTDGDSLTDGEEVNLYATDPLDADTDNDGIADNLDAFPTDAGNGRDDSTAFDYDGDQRADIAVRRPSNFHQYIYNSSDTMTESGDRIQRISFGRQQDDVPVAGDFDGDKITDIAIRRPSTGYWYVINSSGQDLISGQTDGISRMRFGLEETDIPAAGDYDGDGIDDIAVFRPSTQFWYIKNSSGVDNITNNADGITRLRFGSSNTDIPVPADYDGDGQSDIAVRVVTTREWLIRNSSGTDYLTGYSDGISRKRFGLDADDIPVKGDFDGDGRDDIAVRRPSNFYWYVLNSSKSSFNSELGDGIQRVQFGRNILDIPIAADYDGDGITDFAVRRPSNFTQYMINSSNGEIESLSFGRSSSDIPLAAPISIKMQLASQ